jgi:DNA repair protein RecO
MLFIKINGLILHKEKTKENDAIVYILTKNNGIVKCFIKGLYKATSKNLTLFEIGNLNKLFILTNLNKFQIISALPLKIVNHIIFNKYPYIFIWSLKLIKNLNLKETPKIIWFILTHIELYLNQNAKNFPHWFLFHLLKELGYEIDLERCYKCFRKINKFAFFDYKNSLFCYKCHKESYLKINSNDLKKAKNIKNILKIPHEIPIFLKKIIRNTFYKVIINFK